MIVMCEVSIQKVDIEKIRIIPVKYETPEKKIKGNKRKSEWRSNETESRFIVCHSEQTAGKHRAGMGSLPPITKKPSQLRTICYIR